MSIYNSKSQTQEVENGNVTVSKTKKFFKILLFVLIALLILDFTLGYCHIAIMYQMPRWFISTCITFLISSNLFVLLFMTKGLKRAGCFILFIHCLFVSFLFFLGINPINRSYFYNSDESKVIILTKGHSLNVPNTIIDIPINSFISRRVKIVNFGFNDERFNIDWSNEDTVKITYDYTFEITYNLKTHRFKDVNLRDMEPQLPDAENETSYMK